MKEVVAFLETAKKESNGSRHQLLVPSLLTRLDSRQWIYWLAAT